MTRISRFDELNEGFFSEDSKIVLALIKELRKNFNANYLQIEHQGYRKTKRTLYNYTLDKTKRKFTENDPYGEEDDDTVEPKRFKILLTNYESKLFQINLFVNGIEMKCSYFLKSLLSDIFEHPEEQRRKELKRAKKEQKKREIEQKKRLLKDIEDKKISLRKNLLDESVVKTFEEFDVFKKEDDTLYKLIYDKILSGELLIYYCGHPADGRYIYKAVKNEGPGDEDYSDIDPYGEEQWNEIPQGFQIWREMGLAEGSIITVHFAGKQIVIARKPLYSPYDKKYNDLKKLLLTRYRGNAISDHRSSPYDVKGDQTDFVRDLALDEAALWSDNYLIDKIIKKVEQGVGQIDKRGRYYEDVITYTYNKRKKDSSDPYGEEVWEEDTVVRAEKDKDELFPVYHVKIINGNEEIKLNTTNGRKLYKALLKRYKEDQLGDILEENMSNDEFYVLIKHNNKKSILSISKYDGRWHESHEGGDRVYGIGKAYMGNMTPEQIVDTLKRNYDYAKLLTDEEILDYI